MTHEPKPSNETSALIETQSIDPALNARDKLDQTFAAMAAYDPSDRNAGIPYVHGEVVEFVLGDSIVPADILVDYAAQLKFVEDSMANWGDRKPDYWMKLEQLNEMQADNTRTLYAADGEGGALHAMLAHQVTNKESQVHSIEEALKVLKKVYGVDTVAELINDHADDPTFIKLCASLKNGVQKAFDFYVADTRYRLKSGTQEKREWLRNTVMMSTSVTDPEEADAYVYSMSRSTMGDYSIDTLIERINEYGSTKLSSIRHFANISALASYSDAQLDRMYKLSKGDRAEIERLKEHDVIVTLINMEGDNNGVSEEVAGRLDDDAKRNLFFEINDPAQVYGYLKKLHDMGIRPTTLIFASHGSRGQFYISERPSLDATDLTDHVTLVIDQNLADVQAATVADGKLKGYDIAQANGLVRSIQRFMQPSRAIDDPDRDLGRKKIISLSCGFDGETRRGGLGANGEVVKREKTTLLRRLGEVLVERLADEHIDIYGADISTNQQTRTPRGFYYNQVRDGLWAPYHASVMHVDGKDTKWHRLNEVQLRK